MPLGCSSLPLPLHFLSSTPWSVWLWHSKMCSALVCCSADCPGRNADAGTAWCVVLPGIAGILPSASGQVNMFKCERDYFSLHSPLIKEVLERCCERTGMYFKVVLDWRVMIACLWIQMGEKSTTKGTQFYLSLVLTCFSRCFLATVLTSLICLCVMGSRYPQLGVWLVSSLMTFNSFSHYCWYRMLDPGSWDLNNT